MAGLAQRCPKSAHAAVHHLPFARPADRADAAVTEAEQMLGGERPGHRVVGSDRRDAAAVDPVDADDGQCAPQRRAEIGLVLQ
jgi:hypothetical protein